MVGCFKITFCLCVFFFFCHVAFCATGFGLSVEVWQIMQKRATFTFQLFLFLFGCLIYQTCTSSAKTPPNHLVIFIASIGLYFFFFLNFRSFPSNKGQMWSYTEHFKLWWDVNWNVFFFIFNQISCMKVVAFWLWVTLEKVQEPDSSFPQDVGSPPLWRCPLVSICV